MDKQKLTNKIEQLIAKLNLIHASGDAVEMRKINDDAIAVAIQIRAEIRKA